jgi:hypothetical protein
MGGGSIVDVAAWRRWAGSLAVIWSLAVMWQLHWAVLSRGVGGDVAME